MRPPRREPSARALATSTTRGDASKPKTYDAPNLDNDSVSNPPPHPTSRHLRPWSNGRVEGRCEFDRRPSSSFVVVEDDDDDFDEDDEDDDDDDDDFERPRSSMDG